MENVERGREGQTGEEPSEGEAAIVIDEENNEPGDGQVDIPASLDEDRGESSSGGMPYTNADGMPGPSHVPNSADSDYQVSSMAGAFEEDDMADIDYDPGRPRRSSRRNWPCTRRRSRQRRPVCEETSDEEEEEEEQEFASSSQSDEESVSEVCWCWWGFWLASGPGIFLSFLFSIGNDQRRMGCLKNSWW